jgi:hypothetical protein
MYLIFNILVLAISPSFIRLDFLVGFSEWSLAARPHRRSAGRDMDVHGNFSTKIGKVANTSGMVPLVRFRPL